MADTRHKNSRWELPADGTGRLEWTHVQVALLMDIRDEMQRLNNIIGCTNFLAIPYHLEEIRKNTRRPRRRKRK
jgi:hypothetical protein